MGERPVGVDEHGVAMDDDEWELRLVRKVEGSHRPQSNGTPGAERDLLYRDGTNGLLGPTESKPVDEYDLARVHQWAPEPSEDADDGVSESQQTWTDVLAEIIAYAAQAAFEEIAVPYFKGVVAPAVRRKMHERAERRRSRDKSVGEQAATDELADQPPAGETSTTVNVAADDPLTMSSADYRQWLYITLAAESWVAQQKDKLAKVRIEDDELTPQLKNAIDLVLERTASSLDAESLALISEYLSDVEFAEAGHLPLIADQTVGRRRLTTGEPSRPSIRPPAIGASPPCRN